MSLHLQSRSRAGSRANSGPVRGQCKPSPRIAVLARTWQVSEDVETDARAPLSPEEQAELRQLVEENQRLRQAVNRSSNQLGKQQLDRLSKEYNNLLALAKQAGLSIVDESMVQKLGAAQAATAALPKAAMPVKQAPAPTPPSSKPAPSYASPVNAASNSASTSVPAAPVQTRSPAPPPAQDVGHARTSVPSTSKPASSRPSSSGSSNAASSNGNGMSRSYMKDMASMSVELDSTMDEDEDGDRASETPATAFSKGRSAPAAVAKNTKSRDEANSALSERVAEPAKAQLDEKALAKAAKAKARAVAKAEVEQASRDLKAAIVGKEKWMLVTVPEKPVAGEDMLVLFNRQQSEALKVRPRIVMQYAFNRWEFLPEPDKIDLTPAPLVKNQETDFWWCRVKVPEETFELNFVFSDNENAYENNTGKDFYYPVEHGVSYEEWVELSTQWALEKEIARREAEAKVAEQAEIERLEALAKSEAEAGRRRAEEVVANMAKMQEKGLALDERDRRILYYVSPLKPEAGGALKLRYNRKASPIGWFPIKEGDGMNLLYGFNNWKGGGKVQLKRIPAPSAKDLPALKPKAPKSWREQAEADVTPAPKAKGAPAAAPASAAAGTEDEWWEAVIDIPLEAVVLNFVVNAYEHYDNNGKQDYHVAIALPSGETLDTWRYKVAEEYRTQAYEARVARETEAARKAVIRDAKKKIAQEQVMAVERRKVRHVLFTDPEVVEAGGEVTIYYNPADTVLNGRKDVYLLGGWNRWNHPRPFGPIQMQPPGPGEVHFAATVPVPKDAYKMDFVFADVPSGAGTYDNRGGFDYHLPVEGALFKERSLHVVHISVEMAPVAKVGGLGDVVTALGRAVKDQGHLVEVIMPKYAFLNHSPVLSGQMRYETEFDWGGTKIFVTTAIVENLRVFLIEPKNGFFDTQTVYGRYDDEVRFDFFCKAALEFLLKTGRQPDILHCHDWSTAHVAKSYWEDYHPYGLWRPKVIFTIHNLNYGQKKIAEAATACQRFTTVSPTYAFETGGHPSIASQAGKFVGIRNGIDPELWSPEENVWLPRTYDAQTVVEGKAAARKQLRERLNLTQWNDKFIVGVVSRLTGQKGVPLIKHAAYRTVERGGQFVLLGSAPDPKIQADFDELAQKMGGQNAAFQFKYDEPLSHLIYAACDMIVVPSAFEPCGLTQMIAMRFGTVPIVRHTGGLRDTVFDVDYDKERAAWDLYGSSDWQRDGLDATNGFAFSGMDDGALDYAMNRAIDAWYNDREWFHSLQKRVMEQDWTWNRPALDYIELYYAAIKA